MKALFLIFHGFDKANGISKKIHYQVKALKECGVDARLCYYDITPHCETPPRFNSLEMYSRIL